MRSGGGRRKTREKTIGKKERFGSHTKKLGSYPNGKAEPWRNFKRQTFLIATLICEIDHVNRKQ